MVGDYIKPILILTGLVTAGGGGVFFVPRLALKHLFGLEVREPAGLLLVRHWGLLVLLVGALLIWAAFDPGLRTAALVVAVIEKLALAALVFTSRLRNRQLATVAASDALMSVVFLLYLAGV